MAPAVPSALLQSPCITAMSLPLLGDGALALLTSSYSTNSPGETRWGMQRRSEREDAPRCCQGKHLEEDLPRQPNLAAPACRPPRASVSHPGQFQPPQCVFQPFHRRNPSVMSEIPAAHLQGEMSDR